MDRLTWLIVNCTMALNTLFQLIFLKIPSRSICNRRKKSVLIPIPQLGLIQGDIYNGGFVFIYMGGSRFSLPRKKPTIPGWKTCQPGLLIYFEVSSVHHDNLLTFGEL